MDSGITSGYTSLVKTAISLPDDLFERAERLAAQLGLSRSRLYAEALREYLARHTDESITKQLDRVYGESDSSMDPVLKKLQSRALEEEDW